ncbi:MAG: hypothetical protein EOO77_48070 [Oxalobacteraceae bacterium]|nr:MAG: hypothetical protein EOO77_48070 [Oxalobacteraceae bacterium]
MALVPLMQFLGLPIWVGAVMVSILFFGREAGPREHQLKRQMGPVKAWLGAETAVLWTGRNWMEWLTPTLAAAAVVLLNALI